MEYDARNKKLYLSAYDLLVLIREGKVRGRDYPGDEIVEVEVTR